MRLKYIWSRIIYYLPHWLSGPLATLGGKIDRSKLFCKIGVHDWYYNGWHRCCSKCLKNQRAIGCSHWSKYERFFDYRDYKENTDES